MRRQAGSGPGPLRGYVLGWVDNGAVARTYGPGCTGLVDLLRLVSLLEVTVEFPGPRVTFFRPGNL